MSIVIPIALKIGRRIIMSRGRAIPLIGPKESTDSRLKRVEKDVVNLQKQLEYIDRKL